MRPPFASLPEAARESASALDKAFLPFFLVNAAIVVGGLVAAPLLPEVPLRSGTVRKPAAAAAD